MLGVELPGGEQRDYKEAANSKFVDSAKIYYGSTPLESSRLPPVTSSNYFLCNTKEAGSSLTLFG
jgi:hypothetical protein